MKMRFLMISIMVIAILGLVFMTMNLSIVPNIRKVYELLPKSQGADKTFTEGVNDPQKNSTATNDPNITAEAIQVDIANDNNDIAAADSFNQTETINDRDSRPVVDNNDIAAADSFNQTETINDRDSRPVVDNNDLVAAADSFNQTDTINDRDSKPIVDDNDIAAAKSFNQTETINDRDSRPVVDDNDLPAADSSNQTETINERDGPVIEPKETLVQPNSPLANELLLSLETRKELEQLLECWNEEYRPKTEQSGDFWRFRNYVMAEHGNLNCFDSVTYATYGHYTQLGKLLSLVLAWMEPVSVALYSPGRDFESTLDSIRYVRDCLDPPVIRQFVSFHLYFPKDHLPKEIPSLYDFLNAEKFDCSLPPPYETNSVSYKSENNLTNPANVGRNIAREAALTHYVLSSDIDVIPSANLVPRFLRMIARNETTFNQTKKKVFVLNTFELDQNSEVPENKTRLSEMILDETATQYEKKFCPECYKEANLEAWLKIEDASLYNIFEVAKRSGDLKSWEPVFISSKNEPLFEERLRYEGVKDRTTQAYILCLEDYEFMVLNNGYLIHKAIPQSEISESEFQNIQVIIDDIIRKELIPEYNVVYGEDNRCILA